MKKIILALLIPALTTICFAQTTETKYYNDKSLKKEVTQDKAKFSRTIIKTIDSIVTTEIKDLKNNEIVYSNTSKGSEPYGIWIEKSNGALITYDYDFTLIYSDEECKDSISFKTNNYFQDNDSIGYKAPTIKSGETLYRFLAKHIDYPRLARDNGIEGTIILVFSITKEGNIENIVVSRGVHISLDKEAVRVLRKLKLSSAPLINGQATTLYCVALPIKFALQN